MNVFLVLGCLILAAMEHFPSSAHMIQDNSVSTNQVVPNALSQSLDARAPPVVIVELPKVKKNKRAKKQKKNKIRRRPPPPNCVALGSSCKTSNSVCCDFCAFCQCRLFRTVCYCRMGNPRCWDLLLLWTMIKILTRTRPVDNNRRLGSQRKLVAFSVMSIFYEVSEQAAEVKEELSVLVNLLFFTNNHFKPDRSRSGWKLKVT